MMFIRSMSHWTTGGGWMGRVRQEAVQYSTRCGDKIGIIGVPFDRGQKINTEFHGGPKAIRDGGLLKELTTFNGMMFIYIY